MRPYTMDLRERVAAAVDDGLWSQRQIARLFRVSVSFVTRLLSRRRETGTLAPEPHRAGPPGCSASPRGAGSGTWSRSTATTPWKNSAGRRLRLLPDDDLAHPAAARPDPQEEVDARR